MADILGKDLDNVDDSLVVRQPFNIENSEISGPQFMTGSDFVRSAKIDSSWKEPIATLSQARSETRKGKQFVMSTAQSLSDTLANLPSNVSNLYAQLTMAENRHPILSTLSKFADRSGWKEVKTALDNTIDLLNEREYPETKWAQRVIANTTNDVESRKMVRALYNQSQGIDSEKWYNQTGSIIGAMIPAMAVGNVAFSGARAFGAGRVAATRLAENIAKGYIGSEMAGQYAEETAAKYLERTGDKTFSNFTPKDATGLSALAYGAIGAQIEFMGGVEPIMAGALSKVGLRTGLLKAGIKIAGGEATEEFLQGITEGLMRKIDNTSDKTWGDVVKESLNSAMWGAFIGGMTGSTAFYTARRNLVKGIKTALPNISNEQAKLVADSMIDTTGEISSQDPTLRDNLRKKIDLMYKGIDIENEADRIDAMTDLEYSLIVMDANERGIDLAEHELFKGVVNELGWFRAGIPEERRVEIQEINDNIADLKTQLAELNKAKEKDWEKIEEIENKLKQANQYVLEKLSDMARDDGAAVRRILQNIENKYVIKEKKKAKIPVGWFPDNIVEGQTFTTDEGTFKEYQLRGDNRNMATFTVFESPDGWIVRNAYVPESMQKKGVATNFYNEMNQRSIDATGKPLRSTQPQTLKSGKTVFELSDAGKKLWDSLVKRGTARKLSNGTYSFDTGNIYLQNKVSGAAPSTYRGTYIPQYRFILRANKMDASTLSHEMAHDWFEVNFARYRSGKASKEFMRAWGALEKALGVPENATETPRQASEAFARGYEAWIMQNQEWAKLINVEDKDKDAVEKLMKDYQNDLRDIYNDISNPYFKQTWGKLAELKPELKAWFDRVANITDLDMLVERGEMTESQAQAEKLNRAIDNVIENTEDAETAQTLKEVRTLNDTSRYEVEGGNKNSLQERLSVLAKEIDENNMLVKGEKYDTRRDMMQVAEDADNFVKTRLDDALAIINGQMAEVEGLYREDIYTALERLAVENGDLNLLDELKNSEIANRLAKELGQRVAGFRNWKQSTDIDVVSALKSLDNKFNKALENKKAQKEFNTALSMLDAELKAQDTIADKELESTLKDLECQ